MKYNIPGYRDSFPSYYYLDPSCSHHDKRNKCVVIAAEGRFLSRCPGSHHFIPCNCLNSKAVVRTGTNARDTTGTRLVPVNVMNLGCLQ